MIERTQELIHIITLRDGDVLAARSWWRRLLKKEQWAIAHRASDDEWAIIRSLNGEKLKRFGHMDRCSDPDLWPDEVCAEVARLRLTQ